MPPRSLVDPAFLDKWIKAHRTQFLTDFARLVELPSVSSEPSRRPDILKVAKTAVGYLKDAGATHAQVVETRGNPCVFGRIELDPDAPTIGIYNHLDVQPATEGEDGWTMDPFEFTERDGRFYSRGTTDDKGPAMVGLWAARYAREKKLPINVEFFWELEEEIGSPHFHEFVAHVRAKKWSEASTIVVSDTIWVNEDKPGMTRSLRGLVGAMVRLSVGRKDMHSGVVGGAARNPLTELAELIARTVDARTGEILVAGFDKTWKKAPARLLKEYAGCGVTLERFRHENGIDKLRTEKLGEVLERVWARPTFEVHGITGGFHGDGVKTVVPPRAEAKVSFRLVGDQDPEEIFALFVKHVKKLNKDCEVVREGFAKPYTVPAEDQPKVEALKDAMEFAFGLRPTEVGGGGSIGAVLTMKEILGVPVLFLPLSLPEDGYHGPDESFAWKQVPGGIKAFARYFELVAEAAARA